MKKIRILLVVFTIVILGCGLFGYYSHFNNKNDDIKIISVENSKAISVSNYNDYTKLEYVIDNYEVRKYYVKDNNDEFYILYDNVLNKIYYASRVIQNESYDSDKNSYSDNILVYTEIDRDRPLGIINLDTKKINNEYTNYSCSFYSDATQDVCAGTNTTIVEKDRKKGIITIDNFELLTEVIYDEINYIGYNKFIAKKDNEYFIIDTEGNILKKTVNYVGHFFDKFLEIDNDTIFIYDDNLISVDVNLSELIVDKCIFVENSNNVWNSEEQLCYGNLMNDFKDTIGVSTNNSAYDRIGLYFIKPCTNYAYEIVDNKLNKISEEDITALSRCF